MTNSPTTVSVTRPYTRILTQDEDGVFIAEILEFQGCYAEGTTPNKALSNLEKVAKAWVNARRKQGLHIPEPSGDQEMSGRFALRLPRGLHTKAAIFAEREGVSLNTFFVGAIAAAVGSKDLVGHLVESFKKARPTIIQNFQFNLAASTIDSVLRPAPVPQMQASTSSFHLIG